MVYSYSFQTSEIQVGVKKAVPEYKLQKDTYYRHVKDERKILVHVSLLMPWSMGRLNLDTY